MNKLPKTTVIVNPNSAAGRTLRRWPEIEKQLLPAVGEQSDIAFTAAVGDGTSLARQAIMDGTERIIVVGGDGTLNECINGCFSQDGLPLNPDVQIGLIPTGTGGDFRRTFNLPEDPAGNIAVIKQGHTRSIDVGHLTFTDNDGQPAERLFINIVTFGMGGLISKAVNRATWTKILGGTIAFNIATLFAMTRYKNTRVTLETDTGFRRTETINTIGICNGQYCGGGMFLAPHALPDDGLFNVVMIGNFRVPRMIRDFPLIYSGRHLEHPLITLTYGRRITVTSDEEVLLDVDGESPGRLPASFNILPYKINFIC